VALLAPFVVGGIAALWLVRVSEEPAIAGLGWLVSAVAVATSFLLLTTAPTTKRIRHSRFRREREGSARWEARPFGSLLVRFLAVIGPIGVSLATALAIQRALPAPNGGFGVAGQAIMLMAAAFAILYPAERATRKLAPIAMLLKLSLSFPSVAPSRFVVARRSANVGALRDDLQIGRGDAAGTMLALVAALTAHDSRTRGHSERVRVFTEMLAKELNLDEEAREKLRWAALMHDIGKLSVSAEILNKPATLDASQWQAMYTHPSEGARLIAPLAPWLGDWADGVVQHHERLDGSGYPHGLREGEISLGARIIAVADAYDTMVTPRTYHRPIAASAAREEVVRAAGMQFDPQVVRALLGLSIPRLWWRIGLGAWLAQLPLLRPRRSPDKKQGSSGPSGLANLAGIAAIAVTAVLAPLGSIETLLPSVPGLATEAGAPDGVVSQAGDASGPVQSSGPSVNAAEEADLVDAPEDVSSSPAGTSGGSGGGDSDGGDGGGSVGSGGSGGNGGAGGSGGTGGGDGSVGGAGTVVEANEDAVIPGQSTPPPPSPSPVETSPSPPQEPGPGAPPGGGSGSADDGPPYGNAYGHDKSKDKHGNAYGHDKHK
jgi:HD-GYP domain-containing protein (c-di-GMP phosphodiesterase class II)